MNIRRTVLLLFLSLSLFVGTPLLADYPKVGDMQLGSYVGRIEGTIARRFLTALGDAHTQKAEPQNIAARDVQKAEKATQRAELQEQLLRDFVRPEHHMLIRRALKDFAPEEELVWYLGVMRNGVIPFVAYARADVRGAAAEGEAPEAEATAAAVTDTAEDTAFDARALRYKGELIVQAPYVSFVRIRAASAPTSDDDSATIAPTNTPEPASALAPASESDDVAQETKKEQL